MDTLAELGAKVGSDVSFCVYGGTALATGRGEKIQELSSPPACWVVLAKPSIGVSTADLYGGLKLDESLKEGEFRPLTSDEIDYLKGLTHD